MREFNITDKNAEQLIAPLTSTVAAYLLKHKSCVVTVQQDKRTKPQNAKMWPILTDISNQVDWYGVRYTPVEWKQIVSSGLTKQKTAPAIDGVGVVCFPVSTSDKTKAWLSDMIECLYAFGSERNVRWSDESIKAYASYREASNG